ncbi:MAG: hypothetical protein AB7S26_07050 [Sandaracinaceae bacterium]
MSQWQPPPPLSGSPGYADPPRSAPSRTSPLVYVAAGCGSFGLLAAIGMCGFLMVLGGGNEGGVRYANNMESYAVSYNESQRILRPGETLIAYYDMTVGLDATESAFVTDQRVLHHRNGVNTAVDYDDIVDVRSHDEAILGTLIDVTARDGSVLHIEIAPLNGAEGFVSNLEAQRAQHGAAL